MFKITKAEQLTSNIYLMDVVAPRVAKSCKPGQFIIGIRSAVSSSLTIDRKSVV